jgi:hypothetical protein
MRFLLGVIFGIFLTIGVAYVSDAARPPRAETEAKPMVNWDVVDRNFKDISESVQDGWAKLIGRKEG